MSVRIGIPLVSPEFDRELRVLGAAARWGAADPDVVADTAARIDDANADAWLQEWTAAGGVAWAKARNESDPWPYLHAASYYGAALALIDGTDGSVQEGRLWARQRECWDRAVELLGGEQLLVPYERTTLPGYFFSGGSGSRPLLVIDHGSNVATSRAWVGGGAAAHAAGYHWMTFDGPGRQAALRRQGLVLRPDWEAILGPVAAAMRERADVDVARMAVIGHEHAGYGVARALTVERRFASAAVAPGIVDVATPWLDALPVAARAALLDGDRDSFEREVHIAGLFAPESVALLKRRSRSYGIPGTGLFDLIARIREFRISDEAASAIATPMLVCADTADGHWPGQAEQLYARLPCRRELAAPQAGDEALLAWLDRTL